MFTFTRAGSTARVGRALALAALWAAAVSASAQVPFTGAYAQNFDSLATSGNAHAWVNGDTLAGWHLFNRHAAPITTYNADTGSSNAGSFVSYGSSQSAERALGGLGSGGAYFGSPSSGAVAGYIALAASNATAATIDTLSISFNGEQWRNGGNTSAQPMRLQYGISSDGSFVGVGSWTDSLSWESPVTGASAAAVNGNADGRVPVSGTLSGLNWPPGQTLWLRWVETNDSGNDHGLAIDDFSMSAAAAPAGPTFAIAAADADRPEGHGGSTAFTFTVTRGGDTAVAASVGWSVSGSGANPADAADFGGTLPGGSLSFSAGQTSQTLQVAVSGDTDTEPDEGFTVTLNNPSAGSITVATATGVIRNDDASLAFTKISTLQGSGASSPYAGNGTSYTVQGMLTRCVPSLNGFVLQATHPQEMDSDPATSEGLFVYYGTAPAAKPGFIDDCPAGATYQVTGRVSEYNGQTQLINPGNYTLVSSGGTLPAPVQITLPVASVADLERYEGMLVEVSAAVGQLVVTDNYTLGRYGNVTLAAGGRQMQYTELNAPDAAANLAWLAEVKRHQIQLDDNNGAQNPAQVFGRGGHPLSAGNTLRAGDSVARVVGYLDQFDSGLADHETSYRVQPSVAPVFSGADRPTAADVPQAIRAAGVKVAAANVLNYFTTLGTASFDTPLGNAISARGASNAAEFTRQQDKLVASLIGLGADVYGLMEIQNNGFATPTGSTHDGKSAILSLVDALNAQAAAGDVFAYVGGPFQSAGGPVASAGSDAIMVGLIYKRNRLTPVGQAAVPDPDAPGYDAFWGAPAANGNRVPVAQTFQVNHADGSPNPAGEKFTVAVNHFKSKGSGTVQQGMDRDDGQGNSYLAREKAAAQLLQWLATHPTGDADADVLLLGDFNAYSEEKAIQDLIAGGYRRVSTGPSYSFDGLWGSLDHILVSEALADSGQVAGAYQWPINAEEPVVLDYNTDFPKPADSYAPDAYRSSDHNPLLVGLNLGGAQPPQNSFALPLAGGGELRGQLSATSCRWPTAPTLTGDLPAAAPPGWQLPYGLLAFTAEECGNAGSLTLTLTYPQPLPAGAQLWKWGPTHDNPAPHWYTLAATIEGATVTFTLTDGADGDADLDIDGRIVDPVTVGVPLAGPGAGGAIAAVPTLHQWALVLMALLLMGAAARTGRRRR